MAHGQFERRVGEVVGAELVVVHSVLGQDPFGRELPHQRSVSRLFEYRGQFDRQLFACAGQPKGGDLCELSSTSIIQAEEFGLGESHGADGQSRRFD